MTSYIARTREDKQSQNLIDHLKGVALRAKSNASPFDGGELAYLCGIVHDIGKYSDKFQLRIRGKNISVDHATAGGQLLFKLGNESNLAKIAAYCCMGHHGGLPDGGNDCDAGDDSTLHGRRKKDIEDYSAYKRELATLPAFMPPNWPPKDGFEVAFFIRMIFSSLVDADWIDTETYMNKGEHQRGGFANIKTLNERIQEHIIPFLNPTDEVSDLNIHRTNLLKNCLSAAEKPSGLFTLTAPTGSGKTKSSLAFAFKHAAIYNKRRVFYISPYNTIIEQNATVFEDILGAENVLRHYGNYHYDDKSEESSNKRYSVENWDFPMITTSSVQFLESLFAHKPSVCRKLHNIANSIIIFDEAQMIPIHLLIPCVRAIVELVNHYGCTVVFATATQSALDEYLDGIRPTEIVENPMHLHNLLKRNRVEVIEEEVTDDNLSDLLASHQQVLCIVNTRKHAQSLFTKLKNSAEDGIFHLSTTLYPLHRTKILDEIRQRLIDKLSCRVISTSMIEAGVDVDFPVVYRAQAGLDSIVQAAGRCNRENRHPLNISTVYVFTPTEHTPPKSIGLNIATTKQIIRNHNDIASPEAITAYFKQLFYNKGNGALDVNDIISVLSNGFKTCSFPFRQVSSMFRIIEENTKAVYILFEAPELEKRLCNGERTKELFRELANYSVSLYEYSDIKLLNEIGALVRLDEEVLIVSPDYYDKQFGVHLSPEGGKGILS